MKSETVPLTTEEEQIMLSSFRLHARYTGKMTAEQAQAKSPEDVRTYYRGTSEHTAAGFRALEKGLILLGADVQWLYVITSFIILFFTAAAVNRQSESPVLALLLFVLTSQFFLSLNIVSQFMAISICLYACTYAQERKPAVFFCLVALAACFHISALVFIPVWFLPKLRLRPVWCAAAVGAMLLVAQFAYPLISEAIKALVPKYAPYLKHRTEFEWIFFAIGLSVFAAGTYYYPAGKDRPYYKLWYYLNVIGLMVLCFSGRIPYIKRINYFFAAPHFLFLPLMIRCEEHPVRRRALYVLIVLLFLAETIVAVGYLNKNGVLPYQTAFQADRVTMTDSLLMTIVP